MASELYLGAMSGTSLDGLDLALCDFTADNILIDHHFCSFPEQLKQQLYHLSHTATVELDHLYQVEQAYSVFCAETVQNWLSSSQNQMSNIAALGFHGQTIRHQPSAKFPYTVQIGDLSQIAAATGLTVVGDFRRKDIALGGQGAPLVPPFHQAMFGSSTINRVIANIGGISNITVLSPEHPPLGYDTGPGNALLDYWYSQHNQGSYDNEGRWASEGAINQVLLQELLSTPYFQMPFPKSTGRELFNPEWLSNYLATSSAPPKDIQTTLTELTAISLAQEVKKHKEIKEVFICGGGYQNHFLLQRLKTHLETISVHSTSKLGIHPDWIEACAFAWLAKNTMNKERTPLMATTGAIRDSILGGVYFS